MRDFHDACFSKLDCGLWQWNLMEFDGASRTDRKSFQAEKVSEKLTWCGEILGKKCKSASIVTPAVFFIPRSVHLHLTLVFFIPSPGQPRASTQLGNFNPLFHTLRQNPFLITDAFQSRHHYIFRPISFQMHWNPSCWFPRVPFSSPVMLLLVCFCLSLLGESTLLFIFCLSDLCVDGIHRAHLLFFTLLWRQGDCSLVQLLKSKHH